MTSTNRAEAYDDGPAERAGAISNEAARLIAEANHRVANSLSLIAGFARLEAARLARETQGISGPEAATILRNMAARVQGVGMLHQLLAHHPEGDTIDLRDYMRRVCADLEASFGFAGHIELAAAEPGCRLSAEVARPIAAMAIELVTNAVKYAHPAGVTGRITLRLQRNRRMLAIEVVDDGVGLPEGFDTARDGGLGLKLVRSLCSPLQAKLAFDSSPLGLSVRIELPLPAAH